MAPERLDNSTVRLAEAMLKTAAAFYIDEIKQTVMRSDGICDVLCGDLLHRIGSVPVPALKDQTYACKGVIDRASANGLPEHPVDQVGAERIAHFPCVMYQTGKIGTVGETYVLKSLQGVFCCFQTVFLDSLHSGTLTVNADVCGEYVCFRKLPMQLNSELLRIINMKLDKTSPA